MSYSIRSVFSIMLLTTLGVQYAASRSNGFLRKCSIINRLSTDGRLVRDEPPGCGHLQITLSERALAAVEVICKLRNICYNCYHKSRTDAENDPLDCDLVTLHHVDDLCQTNRKRGIPEDLVDFCTLFKGEKGHMETLVGLYSPPRGKPSYCGERWLFRCLKVKDLLKRKELKNI
ncbi:hypothetical protein ScPMuIL_001668 [Solemya velum]